MAWGRWFGKPKVGAITPAPSPAVLIEFECQEEECEFVTLSLTDAQQHLIKTADFRGGRTRYHTIEPRGYLVPLKDLEEPK